LVTHSDTVYPTEEERAHNFAYRDDGVHVHGPGVADIKGGTVVAWLALDALATCHPDVFQAVDWMVASNAAEEELNPDFAGRLIERTPGAAAILVMECGADRPASPRQGPTLVVARKGRWTATIRCPGRAAHAGTGFWHGDNAILRASRLALALAALSDRTRDVSVNVGVIEVGTVVNRVPHEAMLQVEMRAFDTEAFAATRSRILALVNRENATCEQVSELPAWPRRPDAPLAWFADHGPEHRAGLSDANLLFQQAPTLDGLGPVGGHCHCSQPGHQEYAVRSSFVERARVLAEGLVRGLNGFFSRNDSPSASS
jgi:glutamate carboxypeptidase